ncbi:MAG: Stk1 family PASTA domain-containing Ser/Thr kinase [Ruminococcaceae bacterium]|nr:Stk1 family PASTA domain-containing Ser/Thr kinase [Oscillospiraceae bacterium]
MDAYIGRLLDNRYEILEVIGTGGMAVVYKALDHRLNRMVAVKILKDELSRNQEFRRRFHAESQAVAMVSHPNIVGVYDVSRTEESDYIVMELIEGISLKQYLEKKGNLNWRETLHFSMQIAKALEHAHSRGIVHRDIKPHNIMILKDGTIKVADFGIARIGSAQNTLTREALGSVHYISPEQAKGARVDNRSDLYSLGVVMYEMLTGVTPYDGETPVAVAIQHINGAARCPSELMTGIPLGLEQITMHAMNANPDTRYATATDMLRDMEEFRKTPAITFRFGAAAQSAAVRAAVQPAPRTDAERYVSRNTPKTENMSVEQRRAERARREAEKAEERRRRNLTIAIIVAAAVLVLLVVILLVSMFSGSDDEQDGGKTTASEAEEVEVPDLIGMRLEEIDPEDYPDVQVDIINIREEYSTRYDEGYVIDQSPDAGDMVPNGRRIELTVSLGKSENVIPDYTEMTGDELMKYLTDLNLGLKIDMQKISDETIVKDYVVRTDPEMGTELTKNQNVIIYVSLGSNKMPDLKGETQENAQKKLDKMELGLRIEIEEEFSDTVNKGCVIATDPREGKELREKQTVTLYISLGSNKMPDLKGESKSNAEALLKAMDLGLKITFLDEPSDEVEEGKVTRTDPQAGSDLKQNDTIKVYISLGDGKAEVPDVLGRSAAEAKSLLEAAGFVVNINEIYDETVPAGHVISQSALPGDRVEEGTTITIDVSKGPQPTEPPETTEPPQPTDPTEATEP